MKKLMLISTLLLTACGIFPTKEGYEQKAFYWKGRDVSQLLEEWGKPQETQEMPNGNMLYTYSNKFTRHTRQPGTGIYIPGPTRTINHNGEIKTIILPGRWVNNHMTVTHHSCTTNFEVNSKSKRVEAVSFDGNHCVAVPIQ